MGTVSPKRPARIWRPLSQPQSASRLMARATRTQRVETRRQPSAQQAWSAGAPSGQPFADTGAWDVTELGASAIIALLHLSGPRIGTQAARPDTPRSTRHSPRA